MQITINLSDFEVKALSFCMADPQHWAENAIKERARVSADDLATAYVTYALQNSLEVPQTKEAIIDKIIETGFRETAAQVNARFEQEMQARIDSANLRATTDQSMESNDGRTVSTVSPH